MDFPELQTPEILNNNSVDFIQAGEIRFGVPGVDYFLKENSLLKLPQLNDLGKVFKITIFSEVGAVVEDPDGVVLYTSERQESVTLVFIDKWYVVIGCAVSKHFAPAVTYYNTSDQGMHPIVTNYLPRTSIVADSNSAGTSNDYTDLLIKERPDDVDTILTIMSWTSKARLYLEKGVSMIHQGFDGTVNEELVATANNGSAIATLQLLHIGNNDWVTLFNDGWDLT